MTKIEIKSVWRVRKHETQSYMESCVFHFSHFELYVGYLSEVITNASEINWRGIKFPFNSTEPFYLHAIASVFWLKYYEHNKLRTVELIIRWK